MSSHKTTPTPGNELVLTDEYVNLKSSDVNPMVTKYCKDHSDPLTEVQNELIEETKGCEMNLMLASNGQMQLLANMCRVIGARKTLDIGVFTGYSALTIAAALPQDGRLVAMDISDKYTDICRKYWKKAGVENKIDLRIAPAMDTLNFLLEQEGEDTYDFAFIDADKPNYLNYYEACMKLVRSGGIIAIDNVLWFCRVYDESAQDHLTEGIRKLNEFVKNDERVRVNTLWIGDGISLVFKL